MLHRAEIDLHGTSRDIDDRVKAIVQEGLSVYRVDGDALKALRPDVIVTQSQCEVCAVSENDLRAAVCDSLDATPNIVTLKPDALADIWTDIQNVADALGAPERGRALIASIKDRMAAVELSTRLLRERPTVACIEWIDPLWPAATGCRSWSRWRAAPTCSARPANIRPG